MRLPDLGDRELVGRAAGLNDQQIDELAKLECGVAAIYQNDWIEPVLGKVFEFKMAQKKALEYSNLKITDTTKEAKEHIKRVILASGEFVRIDSSLVMKSNLSARLKVLMLELKSGKRNPAAYLIKIFKALYPNIRLAVYKDSEGKYINSMKENIAKECGELTAGQLKNALYYYLGILGGSGKLDPQEYSEIREELKSYVPSDC